MCYNCKYSRIEGYEVENLMKLFAAHSPAPETMQLRFTHAFTEQLSVVELIKSPDNIVPAFVHAHEEYEFIVPHTPIPFLLNEGAVYFGEIDWVFPVQSGRTHGIKYELSNISHSNIAIRKEYFEDILREKGLIGTAFNYEFRLSDELKLYINAFKKEFSKGEKKDPYKLKHLAALICVELIDAGTNPDLDTRKERHSYQKGIRSAAEFLNDNYRRDVLIDELAAMCGFSKNYFITSFKRSLGESPYSYLSKIRLSKAKLLLETTNETVQDIAIKCGFKKSNTLTSLFKAATGKTPTEYRQGIDSFGK